MATAGDRVGVKETAPEPEPEPFDAIVIGSGFGGSVAAWRLKAQNPAARVLLLERGMPYPPRSFPRTPREMRGNFWDPTSSLFGLFEMWRFAHSKVLVSSGLGGGSLIYANVALEMLEGTTIPPGGEPDGWDWPIPYEKIRRRYAEIRDTLQANELPDEYLRGSSSSAAVVKTRQFMQAATDAGLDAHLAKLAISFAAPGQPPERGAPLGSENLHARARRTCTLVGECDLGCNEGAKNSLDYNFLSKFAGSDMGGEIRTCCEATEIRPVGSEYEVRYDQHLAARQHVEERAEAEGKLENDRKLLHPTPETSARVRAKVVVLSAGTLGSTRLLLMSRAALRPLSPALGSRFSSNGDMIMFARACAEPDGKQRELAPSHGPVITSYATSGEGLGRLWVEDAGGPGLSEWGWQMEEIAGDLLKSVRKNWSVLVRRALGREAGSARIGKQLSEAFGDARSSAAMLPLLAMGHDVADGLIQLDRDNTLALDWDPAGSSSHFQNAEQTAETVVKELGGELWPRPPKRERLRGTTVHPLGGCPMGRDVNEGVVDESGEVFGHRGLFVADGSVIPGPVGPNPSLTIAAVADHIATAAADRLATRMD